MVTMFGQYTKTPFTIEQVRLEYPDGRTSITPDLSPTTFSAHLSYINSCTGLNLSSSETISLLKKMGSSATPGPSKTVSDTIQVHVPPTRPDILHECDIMEDVAIAYGFNNLKKTFPKTNTVAQPLPINKLTDLLRKECALAGFTEVLPLILCSKDENFAWLNRKDDGKTAVVLENPKTLEYQIVRTSLLPGLLKSIRENRSHPLPIKIFEVSDIVVKDPSLERKARNVRNCAAMFVGKKAEFEATHGLLDRVMSMLDVKNLGSKKGQSAGKAGYWIEQHEDPTFFPGRAAKIFYRPASDKMAQPAGLLADEGASSSNSLATQVSPSDTTPTKHTVDATSSEQETKKSTSSSAFENLKEKLVAALPTASSAGKEEKGDREIGIMGILHPSVLANFELEYPCSAFEFTLEGL